MFDLGSDKSVDLSTFFVSSSLRIPGTPIPPVYTRVI